MRNAGCVFAEDEAALLEADGRPLEELVERRVKGEPLEVILGWVEFAGIRVLIDPGVFVPRQRTAYLVKRALKLAREGDVVLDLCCGAGAIGAAIASQKNVEVYAADIDPAAVANARRNLPRVYEGDLFDALPSSLLKKVNLLVVNAPYVPTDAIELMPREARDFEPLITLDGGSDGVAVHRRIAEAARPWLAEGAHVLVETSREQAPLTAATFEEREFVTQVKTKKYSTVVIATQL